MGKKISARRLTIGTKLNALLALLLIVSITSLVWLSTSLFVEDNTALIQQMNSNTANAMAMRTRELFSNVNGRAKFLGAILLSQAGASPDLQKQFFKEEPDQLGVFVFHHSADGQQPQLTKSAFSEEMTGLGDGDGSITIGTLTKRKDFSLERLGKGENQVGVVNFPSGAPAIAIGLPLVQQSGDKFSHTLITFVRHSRFFDAFSENDLVTSFMVDHKGELIVHPDPVRASIGESVANLGIVQQLLEGFNNGQTRYIDPLTQEARLGAFKTVGFGGLGVVSEVSEAKAFAAAEKVKFRSILMALVVLCISFLVGYFFSGTITWPLILLTEAADQIAEGNFSIRLVPRGRDELAALSNTFNKMAQGLIERDRVKDIFNRFHNKEIADKLLSGEVNLGGERREATIFFSDIRGFTGMSESMEPEAVVEMLNEYMTRMVSVIRAHQGVVDKYVGDAIMAIWGVPIGQPNDTANAVKACLEMRKALDELNKIRLARGQVALKIGMGLNRGSVIAGNIGSNEKMEYTVIGDAVNLASRMESMTKEYGSDLLVSRQVYDQVSTLFVFEQMESARVKGKSEAIEVFQVRGYVDEMGQKVLIETPYSNYAEEKSDKGGRSAS